MSNLRETIRAIIQDDALYRRKDIPGDIDDPVCDSGCNCQKCADTPDYVTPKYALYSLIGDAIGMYDQMPEESFDDDQINDTIFEIADFFHSIKD